MKKIATLLALLALCASSAVAQTSNSNPPAAASTPAKISSAKEAAIRHLLDVAGTKALVVQMMDMSEQNIKPMMKASLPPGEYRDQLIGLFFDRFHQKRDTQVLIDMAVSAYDKYFTEEEINGLAKFYDSPLGHKAVTTLPKLTAEMQQLGRTWGEQIGKESMTEVLNEHPDLASALEEAAKKSKAQ